MKSIIELMLLLALIFAMIFPNRSVLFENIRQGEYNMLDENTNESKNSTTVLAGAYVIGTHWSQHSYTFDENGNVTIQANSAGYDLYSQTGTYQISENGNQISFSFPTSQGIEMIDKNLSNTFSFSRGADYIMIDGHRYDLAK